MMSRVKKHGFLWSSPVCGSWVAAPLVHTNLDFAMVIFCGHEIIVSTFPLLLVYP